MAVILLLLELMIPAVRGNDSDTVKSVQKRWVPRYPYNSCYAVSRSPVW